MTEPHGIKQITPSFKKGVSEHVNWNIKTM